jgi:hypothetical protein
VWFFSHAYNFNYFFHPCSNGRSAKTCKLRHLSDMRKKERPRMHMQIEIRWMQIWKTCLGEYCKYTTVEPRNSFRKRARNIDDSYWLKLKWFVRKLNNKYVESDFQARAHLGADVRRKRFVYKTNRYIFHMKNLRNLHKSPPNIHKNLHNLHNLHKNLNSLHNCVGFLCICRLCRWSRFFKMAFMYVHMNVGW